jgi:hypothetical protein
MFVIESHNIEIPQQIVNSAHQVLIFLFQIYVKTMSGDENLEKPHADSAAHQKAASGGPASNQAAPGQAAGDNSILVCFLLLDSILIQ